MPTNDNKTRSQQSQEMPTSATKEMSANVAKAAKLLLSLCLALGYFCASFVAYASPSETTKETQSFYDDHSWHGGWDFVQLIYASGAQLPKHQDNGLIAPQNKGEILVLISPKSTHFSKNDFNTAIDNGYRLLIFDSKESSIHWLNDIYPGLRLSQGQDPEAAHINANPMLPVVTTTLNLGSTPVRKRFAFNHPQALAGGHAFIGNSDFGYAFIYPKLSLEALRQSDLGFALIFRDQSLPSSLMLKTLDNRSLLFEAFRLLCPKTGPCRVHLFEPTMAPVFEAKQDSFADMPDKLKTKLLELENQASSFYRQNQEAIDKWPWKAIGIAFILFWSLLAILMAYPLTRD